MATDTKGPERRISTAPTSAAMPLTSKAAISVATSQPTGSQPMVWSREMPASQPGRSGR